MCKKQTCVSHRSLGKPTPFFDHVHLEGTQRQCDISKDVDNYRTMFESRIFRKSIGKTTKRRNIGDFHVVTFPVSSPQSRDYQQFFQLAQRVVHVSAPSHAALLPSQLSEDPSRTFDSHVSIRCFQLVSMVFHRKPKHPVEKIPPSYHDRSLKRHPQLVLQHQ